MQISDQTREILKNFASINESIILYKGDRINTTSNAGNVMARGTISEEFPSDACIYNLNELLGTLVLFTSPDLEFHETHLTLSDDDSALNYFFADPTLINISTQTPAMDKLDQVLEFTLTHDALSSLQKAASVMSLPDLILINNEGELVLKTTDAKNSTSNNYGKDVGSTDIEEEFEFRFRTENLKLIDGDYAVTIAGKNGKYISQLENLNTDLTYYIALEPGSHVG